MLSLVRRLVLCRRGAASAGAASSGGGSGFGAHDISLLGGLCLITNTILGSGMVQIPSLFQASGWLLPTAAFLAFAALSAVAALYLARTVTRVPGNADLSRRVEYSLLMRELLPRGAYWPCLAFLVLSLVAQNVSNVIVSSQVMDDALLVVFKRTCALVLYPPPAGGGSPFTCIAADSDTIVQDSPFGPGVYTVSLGYLLVAALTVPLSYLSLDDNVIFQIVGVALIVACELLWIAQFCALGLSTANLPAWSPPGSTFASAYAPILSTVLFNFAFPLAVPAWLNEKGPAVSARTTIVASVAFSTALYLLLGFFGALSPLNFAGGADLLSLLVQTDGVWLVSKVAVFIFPAANLMTSIPIFSLLVRYNLVNARLLPPWAANLFAVGAPWALSLFFYAGNQLSELINWSAALGFALVNLIVPMALYLRQRAAAGTLPRAAAAGAGAGSLQEALLELDPEEEEEEEAPEEGGFDGGAAGKRGAGALAGLGEHVLPSAAPPRWLPAALAEERGAEGDEPRSPHSLAADAAARAGDGGSVAGSAAGGQPQPLEDMRPSCACFRRHVLSDAHLAQVLFGAASLIAVAALVLQIYSEVEADTSGSGGGGDGGGR